MQLTDQQVGDFAEMGFTVIEGLLDLAEVDALRLELDRFALGHYQLNSVEAPGIGGRPSEDHELKLEKMTDSERLRARESGTGSGPGAPIERLPLAAVLDDIRSLWNVGSIFRSADGCGVRKLWLAGITGAPPRAEITKTALGAEEQVAWDYRADVLEAIEQARADGYEAVIIEAGDTAASLDDFRWPERPCLVLGNEATGVSPLVLDACEHRLSIPMCGGKESFGIAAHRAARALAPDHPEVVFRG